MVSVVISFICVYCTYLLHLDCIYRWLTPFFDVNTKPLTVYMFLFAEIIKVGDNKKVHQIELIPSEQLIAVISGRNGHVRLYPMAVLDDREADFHKIAETKGCQTLVSGTIRQGSLTYLFVSMKKTDKVMIYELNKSKTRHRKLRDILVPGSVQWMGLQGDKLCIGFQSGFLHFNLQGDGTTSSVLHPDDHTLAFIEQLSLDALCAVEISSKEMLLCFSSIGVYVDCQGRRSRQQELMWPATPTACREWPSVFLYWLIWLVLTCLHHDITNHKGSGWNYCTWNGLHFHSQTWSARQALF